MSSPRHRSCFAYNVKQSGKLIVNLQAHQKSHRLYGANGLGWDAFPGVRFASPWAIFDLSLRGYYSTSNCRVAGQTAET